MAKFVKCLLLICFLGTMIVDAQKRQSALKRGKGGSNVNVLLVKATYVQVGFNFVQGAEGFLASAKEWIDGEFEQSVATVTQELDVQRRSALLMGLIPGREYLIQVQALNTQKKPFGAVQETIVRTSQMCYVCNGVDSNEECNSESDVVECPHDKNACLNVMRYDNDKITISKRCAQYDARYAAKTSAADCTGPNAQNAACRCMCRSNLCNKLQLPCVDECLDTLPQPMKSTLKCTNGNKVGSTCRWQCPKGYKLQGLKESKCRGDRTWSVMSPPKCIHDTDPRRAPKLKPTKPAAKPTARARPTNRISVKQLRKRMCPVLEVTTGAEMKCTDGRKQNSICSFECKEGFTMEGGTSIRVCAKGSWTGSQIICKEILCPSLASEVGFINCSNSEKIGSVCNFAKPTTRTCGLDGAWTSSSGCSGIGLRDFGPRFIECDPLETPAYGDVSCTEGTKEGSVCTYTCAKGYNIIGETLIRRCDKGKWSGSPVTCEEIKCGSLEGDESIRSVTKCTNDDRVGSVCEVLVPAQVSCHVDGQWSMPYKKPQKCEECSCP